MKKILLFLLAFALVHVSCSRFVEYGEYGYTSTEAFDASSNAGVTVFGVPNTEPLTVGDLTPDGKGVIFWVNPKDNTCGKAISIARSAAIQFDSAADTSYVYSSVNGWANSLSFEAGADDPSTLTAINFCREQGDYWYLPSIEELNEIFEVYNGRALEYSSTSRPSTLESSEIEARNAFDAMLTQYGGAVMNQGNETTSTGYYYWSCTENPSTLSYIYRVRFGGYALGSSAKTATAYARAIQIIGAFTFPAETDGIFNLESKETVLDKDVYASTAIKFESTFALSSVDISWDDEGTGDWLDVTINDSTLVFTAIKANDGVGLDGYRTTYVTLEVGQIVHLIKVSQYAETDYQSDGYVGYENFATLSVGDLTPDGLGMVYWVSPTNNKVGKAIALTAIPGSFSYSSDASQGVTSSYNGMANTHSFDDTADGATYAKQLGDHWYIPSIEELRELHEIFNGSALNKSSASYRSTPNGLEAYYRDIFNSKLKALGGSEIGYDCNMWSSTEDADGNMKYVRFDEFEYLASQSKTGTTSFFYRPVQIIGNHTFTGLIGDYIAVCDGATKNITEYQMDQTAGSIDLELYTESAGILVSISPSAEAWLEVNADISGEKLTLTTTSDNATGTTRSGTVALTVGDVTEVVTVYQKTTIAADKMAVTLNSVSGDIAVVNLELPDTYTSIAATTTASDWAEVTLSELEKTLTIKTTAVNTSATRTGIASVTVDGVTLSIGLTQSNTNTVIGTPNDSPLSVGDKILDPETGEYGIVIWVDPDDITSGKMFSAVEGYYAFVDGTVDVYSQGISTDNYDGYANTYGIVTVDGFSATSLPAAYWITQELGKGWYLPARYELYDFLEATYGDGLDLGGVGAVTGTTYPATGLDSSIMATLRDLSEEGVGNVIRVDGGNYLSSTAYASVNNRMGRHNNSNGIATGDIKITNLSAKNQRYVRAYKVIGTHTFD